MQICLILNYCTVSSIALSMYIAHRIKYCTKLRFPKGHKQLYINIYMYISFELEFNNIMLIFRLNMYLPWVHTEEMNLFPPAPDQASGSRPIYPRPPLTPAPPYPRGYQDSDQPPSSILPYCFLRPGFPNKIFQFKKYEK